MTSNVIFGEKGRFAIEIADILDGIAAIRLWVGGVSLGDVEQHSVIGSLQLDAEKFRRMAAQRQFPDLSELSAQEVRRWHSELVSRVAVTSSEAAEIDRLVDAVQPFAYAPEGLAEVCVVVLCGESACSVTGWSEFGTEIHQVVISRVELNDTLEAFAAWSGYR